MLQKVPLLFHAGNSFLPMGGSTMDYLPFGADSKQLNMIPGLEEAPDFLSRTLDFFTLNRPKPDETKGISTQNVSIVKTKCPGH